MRAAAKRPTDDSGPVAHGLGRLCDVISKSDPRAAAVDRNPWNVGLGAVQAVAACIERRCHGRPRCEELARRRVSHTAGFGWSWLATVHDRGRSTRHSLPQ